MEFIQCRLCGRHFEEITTSHLRTEHGISLRQYEEMYPDAPTMTGERSRKLMYVRTPEMGVGIYERTPDMMTGRYERTSWHNEVNSKGHIGNKHTPETKQKIGEALLKFCSHPKESRRKSQFMTDKYKDPEEREKTRQAVLLAHSLDPTIAVRIGEGVRWNWKRQPPEVKALKGLASSGENNPNWRGGLSRTYGYGWRDVAFFIFIRDGWTCQKCGGKRDLTCHHIDHDTDNWDDTNLITLCRSCNASVNGNDRGYWEEYFGGKVGSLMEVSNASL